MARFFSLDPPEYQVPAIAELRRDWRNVPDSDAVNVIAVEAQYLEFHRYLLASLRHRDIAGGAAIPIGLSVRAGALKTATLICASIAEAALRAHAERRGYPLPANPRHRTFGKVLGVWEQPGDTPRAEVAAIWPQLQSLHTGRNNIHLYKVVENNGEFYDLLHSEEQSLNDADNVLATLRALTSVAVGSDTGSHRAGKDLSADRGFHAPRPLPRAVRRIPLGAFSLSRPLLAGSAPPACTTDLLYSNTFLRYDAAAPYKRCPAANYATEQPPRTHFEETTMPATDDTSKKTPTATAPNFSPETSALELALNSERSRLLQVHSVLHCLYEVLLYADGEDASTYAEAAHLAAMLIDDVVANLDPVKLRPMIEAIERKARVEGRYAPPEPRDDAVREPRAVYIVH